MFVVLTFLLLLDIDQKVYGSWWLPVRVLFRMSGIEDK